MTHKEKRLAAHFLRLAADSYSNHGCNDMGKEEVEAAGFTKLEAEKFAADFKKWNGEQDDDRPFERLGDFEVMGFLAALLKVDAN